MKYPKAYKNVDFLMSDEAREVRLLCEYLEPRTRLARINVRRGIVFFGSARIYPQPQAPVDHYAMAAQLAERLARWTVAAHEPPDRFYFCTGGGSGLMQAVHEGAARVDRSLNVGLNISLPREEQPNVFMDPHRIFEFHYFFMRKFWFMNLAQAFVVLPGGFGTMDEFFEVLTLTQTRKAVARPMILFDSAFWNSTVNFRNLAERGLISPEDLDLFRMVDTVDEAYGALTAALTAAHPAPGERNIAPASEDE